MPESQMLASPKSQNLGILIFVMLLRESINDANGLPRHTSVIAGVLLPVGVLLSVAVVARRSGAFLLPRREARFRLAVFASGRYGSRCVVKLEAPVLLKTSLARVHESSGNTYSAGGGGAERAHETFPPVSLALRIRPAVWSRSLSERVRFRALARTCHAPLRSGLELHLTNPEHASAGSFGGSLRIACRKRAFRPVILPRPFRRLRLSIRSRSGYRNAGISGFGLECRDVRRRS